MMAASTAVPTAATSSPFARQSNSPYNRHQQQYHSPGLYAAATGGGAQVHQPPQYYRSSSNDMDSASSMLHAGTATASGSSTLSAATVRSSAAKRASAKAAAANKKAMAAAASAAAAAAAGGQSSASADDEDDDEAPTPSTKSINKAHAASPSQTGSPAPTPDGKASGDWVVPQRAKPGRKPSQEEPLTKRQAQNRASQRAFRERKQSHVATLEAKVAAFEAEKLTRDAQQKETLREINEHNENLRAANETLNQENASLKDKIRQLESALSQARLDPRPSSLPLAYPPPPPPASSSMQGWAPCNDAGCRAPVHEQHYPPPAQRRKRPLPTRKSEENITPPRPSDHSAISHFGAMTIAVSSDSMPNELPHRQHHQQPQHLLNTHHGSPTFGGGSAFSDHEEDMDGVSLSYLPSDRADRSGSPDFLHHVSGGSGSAQDIDMDRDCGFCTDATPCLCRGDAILDLTGMEDEDLSQSSFAAAGGVTSGVDRMVKIEEEAEEDLAGLPHESTQQSQSQSAAAAIAIPSRQRNTNKPKLWSTISTNTIQQSSSSSPSNASPSNKKNVSKKSKLWWTRPATAQTYSTPSTTSFVPPGEKQLNEQVYVTNTITSTTTAASRSAWDKRSSLVAARATQAEIEAALCSGDPSNCPACATDPALAAFCEAVAEGEESSSTSGAAAVNTGDSRGVGGDSYAQQRGSNDNDDGQAALARGAGVPTRPPLPQSSSATSSYAIPLSTSYRPRSTSTNTIPTLRSLDLDLDKGASPSTSRTSAHSKSYGGYSIPDAFRQLRSHPGFPRWQGGLNLLADVVSGRGGPSVASSSSTIRRTTGISESIDREVMLDDEEQEPEPQTASRSDLDFDRTATGTSFSATRTEGSSHLKRRRLYVENDRVQEALRMLDFGAVGGGSGGGGGGGGGSSAIQKLPRPSITARPLWSLQQPQQPLYTPIPTSTSTSTAMTRGAPCMECPCPCPWAQSSEGRRRDEGGRQGGERGNSE